MPTPAPARPVRASFRLRTVGKAAADAPQPLYLELRQGGTRKRIATGLRVRPSAWNAKRQTVRVTAAQMDAAHINHALSARLTALRDAQRDIERDGGAVTVDALTEALAPAAGDGAPPAPDHRDPGELIAAWRTRASEGVDLSTGKELRESTRKTYLVELNRVLAYDPQVTFAKVTLTWYRGLVAYLRGRGLTDGSIGRCVAKLKAVLRAAEERGQVVPQDFNLSAFKVYPSVPDKVALTAPEFAAIAAAPDLTAREQLAREWFLVMGRTGLRYSDAVALHPRHYVRQADGRCQLHVTARKTGELCCIPVSDALLDQLPPGRPDVWPRPMVSQELNRALKRVGRKAGLTRPVVLDGADAVELCELLTCHTARRTFATLLYAQRVPLELIRTATGHKTETTLRLYLKLPPEERAADLAMLANFNW